MSTLVALEIQGISQHEVALAWGGEMWSLCSNFFYPSNVVCLGFCGVGGAPASRSCMYYSSSSPVLSMHSC